MNMTFIERHYLNEQSRSRNEICSKCEELGELFVQHFDKIFNSPDSADVNHWIHEMEAWLHKCNSMQFKHNNKTVSFSNLMDWFFTCSKSVDELFIDEAEIDAYNDFIDEYAKLRNIKQALSNIGLIQ